MSFFSFSFFVIKNETPMMSVSSAIFIKMINRLGNSAMLVCVRLKKRRAGRAM